MKYIYILFIIILLTSCTSIIAEPEPVVITETVVETVIVTETVVEYDIACSEELQQYKELLNNLDEYLGYVYYIECTNSIGGTGEGTAFAIEYNQDIYVISSGHIVENEHGIFGDFRIKTNDGWVYLELLNYEVASTVPDYAIFYSDKIDGGFETDIVNTEPDYRLGIDISIQENNNWGKDGSCGSPIIDLDLNVIGIHVGYLQDIDDVLEAIDNLNQ